MKMLNNKKAQVGETITWVVATLIIVVVLGISVFATFSISNEKTVFLDDKKKDIIATKSITNFLRNSDNVKLLESKDYEDFKIKTEKLTEIMLGSSLQSAWDFELSDEEGNQIEINHRYPAPGDSPVLRDFEIKLFLDEIELKYWKKCKDVCK